MMQSLLLLAILGVVTESSIHDALVSLDQDLAIELSVAHEEAEEMADLQDEVEVDAALISLNRDEQSADFSDYQDEVERPNGLNTLDFEAVVQNTGPVQQSPSDTEWTQPGTVASEILAVLQAARSQIPSTDRHQHVLALLQAVTGVLRKNNMRYIGKGGNAKQILLSKPGAPLQGNCYNFVSIMQMVARQIGLQGLTTEKIGEGITPGVFGIVVDLQGTAPVDPQYHGNIAKVVTNTAQKVTLQLLNRAYFQSHIWVKDGENRYDPTTGIQWTGPPKFIVLKDASECQPRPQQQGTQQQRISRSRLCQTFKMGASQTIHRLQTKDHVTALVELLSADGTTVATEKGRKYIKLEGRGWNVYTLQ